MRAEYRSDVPVIRWLDELAEQAHPDNGVYRNTLGVARYRAGRWQDAIAALKKSTELRWSGGDATDFFFLAMAHWQLGDKEGAQKWFDQAVEWMDKHKPNDEEL